ncbi:hypothetical protein DYB32_007186 [Aphanomyces invadans]|uniref:Metallo-beta-lactamase domain-containing protein n=1 Tax=Aphanomyces invadans TaxID=157072 RepID=A0A3R6Z0Q3_9STRA|nr:hypothetical protein DYB32_007186 [Aphanomyces invadans]
MASAWSAAPSSAMAGKKRKAGSSSSWSRYNSKGNMPCPQYKLIQGSTIVVDGFQYANPSLSTVYFLSHFHSDHYTGLTKAFSAGMIYCTAVTAKLVLHCLGVNKKYVHPLPLNQPYVLPDQQGQVTLIEANHCPGAALILFQLRGGKAYLHTAIDSLSDMLIKSLLWMSVVHRLRVVRKTNDLQDVAIGEVKRLVDLHDGGRVLFLFGSYSIGKERLFMEVRQRCLRAGSDAEAEEIASDEDVAGVEDDQAYSVDFEEDLVPSPVKPAKKPAPTPTNTIVAPIPSAKISPPPPPPAVDDDEEPDYGDDEFENDDDNGGYGDASFENESGRTSSPRHHVNLSVPTRPPSPPRTIEKSPPKPAKPAQLPPSPRLARIEEETGPPTREASRSLRHRETQLLDENDELKYQHGQLLRANNDLKNELKFLQQRHVDEKRLRSEKFQQKKRRADERRLQHELVLATTKQTLQDVEAKYIALEGAMATQVSPDTYDTCVAEKREVDGRHRVLSDKYQEALQDIHSLTGKLEAAVDARQQIQLKFEQALVDNKVAIAVVEQRCLVKLQCMQEAMDKARAERDQERLELPENYRLIVDAHRERYEKLEEKLLQDKRELDDRMTRERERFDKVSDGKRSGVAHAELQDKFNALSKQATQQTADNDHKFQLVEREKSALERANAALNHEKLQLAKARMECRQMMEGTRKLDYLLRQQAALGNIYVHPPSNYVKPPASWSVAFDADKEASMY